jgi:hypothetical protein
MQPKFIGMMIGLLLIMTNLQACSESARFTAENQHDLKTEQQVAPNQYIWSIVSRVGLYMHPIQDCVESTHVRDEPRSTLHNEKRIPVHQRQKS